MGKSVESQPVAEARESGEKKNSPRISDQRQLVTTIFTEKNLGFKITQADNHALYLTKLVVGGSAQKKYGHALFYGAKLEAIDGEKIDSGKSFSEICDRITKSTRPIKLVWSQPSPSTMITREKLLHFPERTLCAAMDNVRVQYPKKSKLVKNKLLEYIECSGEIQRILGTVKEIHASQIAKRFRSAKRKRKISTVRHQPNLKKMVIERSNHSSGHRNAQIHVQQRVSSPAPVMSPKVSKASLSLQPHATTTTTTMKMKTAMPHTHIGGCSQYGKQSTWNAPQPLQKCNFGVALQLTKSAPLMSRRTVDSSCDILLFLKQVSPWYSRDRKESKPECIRPDFRSNFQGSDSCTFTSASDLPPIHRIPIELSAPQIRRLVTERMWLSEGV